MCKGQRKSKSEKSVLGRDFFKILQHGKSVFFE